MKRMWTAAFAAAAMLGASLPAPAQVRSERVERVRFARGASSATLTGRITGYQMVDYLVNARAGQRMTVRFSTRGRFTYFLVRGPGSEQNLFDGSTSGNNADFLLEESGDYRIRVFLMRNAARRGESSTYSLTVRVAN